MVFPFVPKLVTLNGVMAIILCYLTEIDIFVGRELCHSG